MYEVFLTPKATRFNLGSPYDPSNKHQHYVSTEEDFNFHVISGRDYIVALLSSDDVSPYKLKFGQFQKIGEMPASEHVFAIYDGSLKNAQKSFDKIYSELCKYTVPDFVEKDAGGEYKIKTKSLNTNAPIVREMLETRLGEAKTPEEIHRIYDAGVEDAIDGLDYYILDKGVAIHTFTEIVTVYQYGSTLLFVNGNIDPQIAATKLEICC